MVASLPLRQCSVSTQNLSRKTTGAVRRNSCVARKPGRAATSCSAASPGNPGSSEVFQGVYGPWRIEQEDLYEVWGYRAGLTVAAAAFAAVAGISLSSSISSSAGELGAALLDPLCLGGGLGLGASLVLIHIYVTPLKRALQVLWLLGFSGGLYLMGTQDPSLPDFVSSHSWGVWLVGPLFAAATGVAVKEGLCYAKAEAAVLALLLPLLLLGHLTQLAPADSTPGQLLLVATAATAAVFAGRKYTQAVKDDIGDKSVFMFMKLSPEEQQQWLRQMQQQLPQE